MVLTIDPSDVAAGQATNPAHVRAGRVVADHITTHTQRPEHRCDARSVQADGRPRLRQSVDRRA